MRIFWRTNIFFSPPPFRKPSILKPLLPPISISASSSKTQILILCGKSSVEDGVADSIVNDKIVFGKSPINVYTRNHKEVEEEEDAFRVQRFMALLNTNLFGRFLLYSPRLGSTQDLVSENYLLERCVLPILRLLEKMENGRILPFLQYVISLAMVEAVKSVCHQSGIQNLDLKIKWPNDLYLNGLKVGGILCTSTYRSKRFNVCAGIGLNIANEKPSISLNSVLQSLHSPNQQLRREDIMATFFNEFEKFYHIFTSQGFQPFEESYCKTWLHSGQRVLVQHGDTESAVTIQGITSEGYLLAIDEDGERCQLHPDGNSFDFFKGLIRRKVT